MPISFEGGKTAVNKKPKVRKNNSVATVFMSSIVAFLILIAFLGTQMASGNDPLLGKGKKVAAVKPDKVLIRKVVITRKITTVVTAKEASAAYSPQATSTYSAPVQSAPAYSAPPAPVQSSAS